MATSSPAPNVRRSRHLVRPAIVMLWGLVAMMLAACPRAAMGQGRMRIGPAIGYEFGVPLMANRASGVVNYFGAPGSGKSYNNTEWFGVQMTFPGLIAAGIDPAFRFSLALSAGRFTSNSYRTGTTIDPADDSTEIPIIQEFGLYSTLSVAQLDMPVGFRLPGGLRAGLGPWFSLRLSSGFIETIRVLSPDSLKLPGVPREWTAGGGESLGNSAFRYGGIFSIALPIDISGRTELEPALHTRLDLGALKDGLGIRSFSFGAGLALLFDPTAGDRTVPPPPDNVPSRATELRVSVDLHSNDSDSVAVMRAERTRQYRAAPMMPVIFFAKGGAAIPERYHGLTSAAAASFTRNSLAQLDAVALYHETLNVIGMRMRGEPSAMITLHGSVAADEPPALARERAGNVRAYLVDVWGITPGRIVIDGLPGKPGNVPVASAERSVTVASADAGLFAPVAAEWIVREWRAPQVRLSRSIASDAGVRNWTITVRRGAEVVARYSSADSDQADSQPEDLGGGFRMPGGDATPEPLIADLSVEDMKGVRATAHDTLRVVRGDADPVAAPRHEVLIYTFTGDAGNDALVASLAESVHDGASITVADLPGERSANWSAVQVAGRMLGAIGTSRHLDNVKIGGVAGDPITSSEHIPEIGFLTSGAQVTIEQ